MFIPPMVDHVTRNDGGSGDIRRIEINPISAASGNCSAGWQRARSRHRSGHPQPC